MSDISQPSAPPPSTPTAPAPQSAPPPQSEVPVNETPVNQPTPLGDTAPPKPPGQESNKASHLSRREALANAFERAKQAQEEAAKAQPRRAKPGMGHNQPPEAMEKAPEAKKPPPTVAQTVERYREGGRFAKAPESQLPNAASPDQVLPEAGQPQQPKPATPLPEKALYREAPGRFSEHAKNEWHTTPESVRGAVHQMAREFQGAYDKYRPDIEVMEQLRPYHDLATKQGTSLRQAFDNYYSMEQKLRQDPVGGLDVIVQNLRLKGPGGEPITLYDMAHHVVNMTPEQHRLTQTQNQQTASDQRIGQLYQTVEQQSQILNQMIYQQRFTGTRQEVDKFAENHPRFDELADLIKSELDLGFSLDVAYQRADRLRPPMYPQAAQTRTQSAQTRKTSISGAPDGNSVATRPSDGRPRGNGEKHPSRREAIAKAMRRVSNGI